MLVIYEANCELIVIAKSTIFPSFVNRSMNKIFGYELLLSLGGRAVYNAAFAFDARVKILSPNPRVSAVSCVKVHESKK